MEGRYLARCLPDGGALVTCRLNVDTPPKGKASAETATERRFHRQKLRDGDADEALDLHYPGWARRDPCTTARPSWQRPRSRHPVRVRSRKRDCNQLEEVEEFFPDHGLAVARPVEKFVVR